MKKIVNINAQYVTDVFAEFRRDSKANCPDLYLCREHEDFSPEGQINMRYIESFADRKPAARLGLIA